MSSGFQFIDIIFLAMVAAFIILRLRNALGRRTGRERPRPDPFEPKPAAEGRDTVVALPERRGPGPRTAPADIAAGDPLGAAYTQIRLADANFAPDSFVAGARVAFEMIVAAFAGGDKAKLGSLLAPDVLADFSRAIDGRLSLGETMTTTLVALHDATIKEAKMDGGRAVVTLRFASEQVSVTRDADGKVVAGDPAAALRVTDLWTFARDTRSRDPNWQLTATATEH
ncbi:MAG: Tim44 domain-containing protein [Alphaproteobacteria bacterium]|nr:Tim44 domain-containing protein [Alphaproteobacteria bacterium]